MPRGFFHEYRSKRLNFGGDGENKPFSGTNRNLAKRWGRKQVEEPATRELFLQEVQDVQESLSAPLDDPQSIEPIEYRGGSLVPQAARKMGLAIFAGSRWGKSRLQGRGVCFTDLQQGIATIVIDEVGASIDNLLDRITYVKPAEEQNKLWDKIIYCNMSGMEINGDTYTPVFPMLQKRSPNEKLIRTAQRYIDMVRKTERNFANAPIMGLARFANILTNISLCLSAYGLPMSSVHDILDNPEEWEEHFERLKDHPEAGDAARKLLKFFDDKRLSPNTRYQWTEPLENRLSFLLHDHTSRTFFTGDTPTVDWEKAVAEGKTILLDFRGWLPEDMKYIRLYWIWEYLLEFIRTRTYNSPALSIVIDELSFFVNGQNLNREKIIQDFQELINVRRGNSNLWLTFSTQHMEDLEELAAVCLRMGSKIFGAVNDLETARNLAEWWYEVNPQKVKRQTMGYKQVPPTETVSPRGRMDYVMSNYNDFALPEVRNTTYYTLEEQHYKNMRHFINQQTGHGLFAQSQYEGHTPKELLPITVNTLDPGQWVNEALVEKARQRLMLRDGERVSMDHPSPKPADAQTPPPPQVAKSFKPVKDNATQQAEATQEASRQQDPLPQRRGRAGRTTPPPFTE